MVEVIGEVGGSSSRWAVLAPDGASIWPAKGDRLPGYNPLSGDGDRFAVTLHDWFAAHHPRALEAAVVHIYGAGCSTGERRGRMMQAMQGIWPEANVNVASDLHAAALGLCGKEHGLVLILGTGMNAGHFDGQHLHTPMPSLGYLLGDEGSGADIGRNLLQDAFYGRIPPALHEALFGVDGPVLSEVLERIHRAAHPAQELAVHTALLASHLEVPYVRDLILGRFHTLAELLTLFFTAEQRRNVYATGSVAYGFRELLAECLLDRGMTLNAVERDPLPGLVTHHQRPV